MKKIFLFFVLLYAFISINSYSQNINFDDNSAIKRIQKDICLLASDSLLGREAGTIGEWMARKYIENRFKEIGLEPLFDTSFFEPFQYYDEDFVTEGTWLIINGKPLQLYVDYYPLGFSSNDTLSGEMVFVGNGIVCEEEGVNSYKGMKNLENKIFVVDLAVPDKYLKKDHLWKSSQKVVRVKNAAERGAKAVIFISTDKNYGMPYKNPSLYTERSNIPVLFVADATMFTGKQPGKAEIAVSIKRKGLRTAYNVAGFINNNKENTVVIGAHYDHLGMGFFDTRDPGVYEVHNGADDNASGVAGIIELATRLKSSDLKNNNYIVIAFSAEEKGLIGSSKFLEQGNYPKEKINYMINLDMIGRLNSAKQIKIYGTGTSDVWDDAIGKTENFGMKITKIKTGIGGSDHTSFNQNGIPAIFLHTGLHSDYHKAQDDCDKINFEGALLVVKYAYNIIEFLNKAGKISYKAATMLDQFMTK